VLYGVVYPWTFLPSRGDRSRAGGGAGLRARQAGHLVGLWGKAHGVPLAKLPPVDVAGLLAEIRASRRYRGQIVHEESFPGRPARYGTLRRPLAPHVDAALRRRGITRLYEHQAEAVDAVRSGASIIVTTGTASGKTLCYLVPVLEVLGSDPAARAMFLYPTKALAQDQVDAVRELAPDLPVGTYDGDTPISQRRRLREEARILLTNPDMLHVGILPHHHRWTAFLRALRFVVLDDMHVYRGVFGSHVALILRRLWRLCRLRGAGPQVICTSATIANPEEFGTRLTGIRLRPIADDGAPRGPRRFVLWNPPVVDRSLMRRRSPYVEAGWLLAALVRRGVRTIVFTKARKVTELIYRYAVEELADAPEVAARVSPYRAGYLPEQRRAIEQRLFRGELLGVVATSALELGIDVGGLDAAVLVGFPGTMASVWQRAGRAGRGEEDSLCILIALEDALDQYLMRQPAYFFGRPVEHATLDPENPYILAAHLRCASSEMPVGGEDEEVFGPRMWEVAGALEGVGELVRRRARWYPRARAYPAAEVDVRTASGDRYRIVAGHPPRLLGTVEASRAFEQLHEGAIYLHQGETYRVVRLDFSSRTAVVEPDEGGYYTEARVLTDLVVVGERAAKPVGPATAYFGEVDVTHHVVEYRRKQLGTDTVLGVTPLEMPPQELRTTALWIVLPDELVDAVGRQGLDLAGGIHALEHAAIGLLPLLAMCDRWDIGGVSYPAYPDTGRATVFIYDGYPGGVGIAEKGFGVIDALLARTLDAILSCPCEAGCPSCIQSPKCGNLNEPLDKQAAVLLLNNLLRGSPRPDARGRGGTAVP
jgi:DEAD/DEAH box helicase domain-containing protein